MAITKAQAKATAKYKAKHPEAAKAYQARSYARRYIKQYADNEGLDELEKLIHIRREELNKQQNTIIYICHLSINQVGGFFVLNPRGKNAEK